MSTGTTRSGVTLIEIILVTAVIAVLALASLPLYSNFRLTGQSNGAAAQLTQVIRNARERAAGRVNNARHGVYFNVVVGGPDSYTLYQGNSYATRNSTYDIVTSLEANLALTTTLAGSEVNFTKGEALPSTTGTVTITNPTNGSSHVITINSLGLISEN